MSDPNKSKFDRYFKRVWIPDESYFQTLARLHSKKIESRSLTLSKFDFQGKPHIFYDDHVQLLRRSDCFVARKIWSGADRLYETFLRTPETALKIAEPHPEKIDRLFSKAAERRINGRPGLVMQSCIPKDLWRSGKTSRNYVVFEGFTSVFEDFPKWAAKNLDIKVHGHLFDKDKVEFAGGAKHFKGGLVDSAVMRDYDSDAFLRNFIWNSRDEAQAFMFGPKDNQYIHWELATDPNATVFLISGAWLIDLSRSNENFDHVRKTAAQFQKTETEHIEALRSVYANATVEIWTLAEFLEAANENLKTVFEKVTRDRTFDPGNKPKMRDLRGFTDFVQRLKNEGMNPYLIGDFREDMSSPSSHVQKRKPYLVR